MKPTTSSLSREDRRPHVHSATSHNTLLQRWCEAGSVCSPLVLVYNGLGEKSMAMHEANVFPPSFLEPPTTNSAHDQTVYQPF